MLLYIKITFGGSQSKFWNDVLKLVLSFKEAP